LINTPHFIFTKNILHRIKIIKKTNIQTSIQEYAFVSNSPLTFTPMLKTRLLAWAGHA